MKRILTLIGAALILAAVPQNISAQDRQDSREQNYQQRHRGECGRLKESLGLSDKQYKKIYKYHLGLYNEQMEEGTFGGPRMDGGMRRPGDGNPEMRQRRDGGNRDERPQMTEEQRAEMQARMKERMEERRAAEQERHEATAKKYKKILTPEQYAKWEEMEAKEAVERELRMKEQRERRENDVKDNGGRNGRDGRGGHRNSNEVK